VILEIDVEASAAERMVDGIHQRTDNARPLLDLLVDEVHDYESELFATGGHGQWAGADLIDTGTLMRELTSNETLAGEDAHVDADVAYAKYLKGGARGAPPRDPAPEPPAGLVASWAHLLLGAIVDGHGL
jgi:hypothetical protein